MCVKGGHCSSCCDFQIPQIFYSLQDSVKAVLLGSVVEANWYETGVPSKSLVEEWHLNIPLQEGKEGEGGGGGMAVASDGHFLYVHGPFGLAKVGSGYGNTQKVNTHTCVYMYMCNDINIVHVFTCVYMYICNDGMCICFCLYV